MAADYAAIEAAALAQLRGDASILAEADAGHPVDITDEPEAPPMERCPCIQVAVVSAARDARRLAGGTRPYDERITMLVRCVGFSAESTADARKRRDAVVALATVALEADRTLGGTVASLTIPSIQLEPGVTQSGIFAPATLTVEILAQS